MLKTDYDRHYGFELIDETESILGHQKVKERESNHVLISYREYDKGDPSIQLGITLEVNSFLLVTSLQKIISYYPGNAFWSFFSDVVAIPEPYVMLFHNRLKIQKEMELATGESQKHLQLLLIYLRDKLPTASQKLDEIEAGRLVEIGFDEAWLLYPPGSVVYTKENEEWRAYKVRLLRDYNKSANGPFTPSELECGFLQFDSHGMRG